MSDYTPTDGEILTAVVLYRAISSVDASPPSIDTLASPEETARYLGEYQRWLAVHDAKVQAETLREFAHSIPGDIHDPRHVADLARGVADHIEREAGLK